MDENKAKQLSALLGALPVSVATRLAQAIELDRLSGGASLPHELILDAMRPTLQRAQSAVRTPTPLRIFCRPFEDLLTDTPRKEKTKGRIARASVMPVWNWISQTLLADATRTFSLGIKTAAMGGKTEEVAQLSKVFWILAAHELASALDGDKPRKSARAILGDDLAVADAQEMGLMLKIGADIVDLQSKLPRHTPSLTEDLVWSLRAIYDRVILAVPDAASYIAVVTMQRLERPWEAMKLPLHVSRQTQDTLISNTDMGMVGEILFNDIEMHAKYIYGSQPKSFDAQELIRHIDSFTRLSSGIVKGVEMRRDGQWGQRLMKDRAAVGGIMDGFMERAVKEMQTALPTIKSGSYAGGPRVPDLSHHPDHDKSYRAQNYVQLVAGCRSFAGAGSFGATNKDAVDQISAVLKHYNEDLLKEMQTANGEKRAIADEFFVLAAGMTALIFSAEEAEILRRRARAISPAAAA